MKELGVIVDYFLINGGILSMRTAELLIL